MDLLIGLQIKFTVWCELLICLLLLWIFISIWQPAQITQSPLMEHTSEMATLSEGGSLRIDEELMARRLKNRERQRRYRAKKRLEADMRKSYMIQQQAVWPVEPQSHGTVNMSETSAASEQVEAHENSPTTTSFVARVYSGRKWKKEARLTHPSEATESQPTMKLLTEV